MFIFRLYRFLPYFVYMSYGAFSDFLTVFNRFICHSDCTRSILILYRVVVGGGGGGVCGAGEA